MGNLFNFEEMNNQLDDYLDNLITQSKTNQKYEKTIKPIDYSKFTISHAELQEEKQWQPTNSFTSMCR